jgi:hypothetical protein
MKYLRTSHYESFALYYETQPATRLPAKLDVAKSASVLQYSSPSSMTKVLGFCGVGIVCEYRALADESTCWI